MKFLVMFVVISLISFSNIVYSTPNWIKVKTDCSSNSMGSTLNCDDFILSRYVNEKSKLKEGKIYIYKKNNHSVIHRFTKCYDKECRKLIFKGDNNMYNDSVVDRSQVVNEIVYIKKVK